MTSNDPTQKRRSPSPADEESVRINHAPQEPSTDAHLFLTKPDDEASASTELKEQIPSLRVYTSAPGVVGTSGAQLSAFHGARLAFTRQMLPNAWPIAPQSVKDWVVAVTAILVARFEDSPPPWQLHIIEPGTANSGEIHNRARLLGKGLLSHLKEKRRTLLKAYRPDGSHHTSDEITLVQVLLLSNTSGIMSIVSPADAKALGSLLSPNPAGYIEVPDNKEPPSRAFKKLVEAISVFALPMTQGEQCVDLGASPGGWSYVALNRGCSVVGVDRSPCDPSIMNHKRFRFIQGNALSWQPPAPVTWLLCDVITDPAKTALLIQTWVTNRWCKYFCVTMKFKGQPDFVAIKELRNFLQQQVAWFDLKHLLNNKNEITWVGAL